MPGSPLGPRVPVLELSLVFIPVKTQCGKVAAAELWILEGQRHWGLQPGDHWTVVVGHLGVPWSHIDLV